MHLKTLFVAAASAALVSAQNNSLAAVLNSTSELSTLNALLGNYTDVVNALTQAPNITIFAPTNAALDLLINSPAWSVLTSTPGLIEAVLSYHVLNGTYRASAFTSTPQFLPTLLTEGPYANVTPSQNVEVRVQGGNVSVISALKQTANVTTPNVNITNGVVHIIDNFLLLPENVSSTALLAGLTSLYGALNATNLVTALDSARDITVFAPTNAAFQGISSALSTLTTEQATSILEYHVLNGTVGYSSLLSNTTNLRTLNGQGLNITIVDGAVFVNSARVIAADVLISGGVVHVIDSVLNPNGTQTVNPSATTPVVAYSGASSGTAAPFTFGISAPATVTLSTTANVASGYTPLPSRASSGGSSVAAQSSTSSAGAVPTAVAAVGAMGAAALFGGVALFVDM